MKKVADAILQLIQNDEIALGSFREDLLNLSAYADKIQPSVEKLTYKDVKKGTIVVALSRLSKTDLKGDIKPKIQITHLSTRSPIIVFTYQKTSDTQRRVSTLNPYLVSPADLFGIMEGESEIVIVASEKAVDLIKDHIGVIPKTELSNLSAVTVQFPESNFGGNILYSLISVLSSYKVNVLNLLPTSNEISFIIDQSQMEQAISALNLFAVKDKNGQK